MSDPSITKTVLFGEMRWLPPVETAEALPPGSPNGAICYVQAESAVYEVIDGKWTRGAEAPHLPKR